MVPLSAAWIGLVEKSPFRFVFTFMIDAQFTAMRGGAEIR
jgi:hypothetical protein